MIAPQLHLTTARDRCRFGGRRTSGCVHRACFESRRQRTVGAVSRWSIVGVPSSAGSYAAGQDQAPAALWAAGLIPSIRRTGLDIHDAGDLPGQIWRPDRDHPYEQNADEVVTCLRELTERLGPLLAAGDRVLVLGGNCTIALAVIAGLQRLAAGIPGLLYIDRHFDLNTPESTTDGALDWMGLAHGLSLAGCLDAVAEAFGPRPLLTPVQVVWLGVEAGRATDWEREQAARLKLNVSSSAALASDPTGVTAAALEALPGGPLAVHVDVDVLDFIETPLAENADGRNSGPTLEQLGEALGVAMLDPRIRALSIGELNPTRAAGAPETISRFIDMLASAVGATADRVGP